MLLCFACGDVPIGVSSGHTQDDKMDIQYVMLFLLLRPITLISVSMFKHIVAPSRIMKIFFLGYEFVQNPIKKRLKLLISSSKNGSWL